MDFWARLIGGSKKQVAANNPQQRLARFKRVYNHILQTWHKTPSLANDPAAIEAIRSCFERLATILTEESRSPAPHLCLQYAAASYVYTAVSKIATTSYNEGVVREAVAVFSALIDSEEEDFLGKARFAQDLMALVGKSAGSGTIGEDTEAEIVEVLFGITAKIRLQPDILAVWFTKKKDKELDFANKQDAFAGATQKEDFPLCYQLIDHVHHEGRIGDFARTGLLYIFESASKSPDLERWIVESDLATLMATGLGALYSQLSRKLSIVHAAPDLPIILALSDYTESQPATDAENMFSDEFKVHMDTFMSYLAFWQDVLEHCRSIDVRQTLTDHFQILFLQQLLYPSLLESSDIDGGSSVAVLTYLRRILDALDHPELIHMILHYLLALPEPSFPKKEGPGSPLAERRRHSLMLLNEGTQDEDRPNPSLFNLVDLILASIGSKNPHTVISALRLVTILVSKNHNYAVGTLLKVVDVHVRDPFRTIGALNAEMDAYLSLAIAIGGEHGVDEAYETHCRDMLCLIESHPCSLRLLDTVETGSPSMDHFKIDQPRNVVAHYLVPEDPLFRSLLRLLLQFFVNDVETNLSLTETFVNLVACGQLRLESWLALEPLKYKFSSEEDDQNEEQPFPNLYQARRRPRWTATDTPPVLGCLQSLQSQLDVIRADVPNLDQLVQDRKHAFRMHEDISEAIRAAPPPQPLPSRSSADAPSSAWTQIPKRVFESTVSPSRSQSPRGRKEGVGNMTSPAPPSRHGGRALVSPDRGKPDSRELSPSSETHGRLMADVVNTVTSMGDSAVWRRRVKFKAGVAVEVMPTGVTEAGDDHHTSSAAPAPASEAEAKEAAEDEAEMKYASLGHVVTNVVILQEFILELVALMQVRASLFQEVKFG